MASDINASISELSVSIDANTTALGIAIAAFTSGVTSIVNGLASIDCSGCPPNGTYPPTDGIVEDDPPPTGFEEYDPVIDDRKCKLSNMYWEDLRTVTEFLRVNSFDDLGAIGIGTMAALLGVILGMLASGPIAWGLGALGALAGIIAFFLVESVDLAALIAILDAKQEELVLALYQATTPEGGKTAFKAVLTTGGATAGQLAFIDAVNMVVALEVLFFKPDGAEGDNIEARLDGYVGDIECVALLCPWEFHLDRGTGDLTANGLERTLSSVPIEAGHTIQIRLPLPDPPGGCGAVNRTYEIVSVGGWTNWPTYSNDSHCGDINGDFIELWVNDSDGAPPPGGEWDARIFRLSSATTFTAQVILKTGSSGPCS